MMTDQQFKEALIAQLNRLNANLEKLNQGIDEQQKHGSVIDQLTNAIERNTRLGGVTTRRF